MQFSDHYTISRFPSDDWFDPILTVDTKLFIDPFLIFQDTDPRWVNAHQKIVDHFEEAFKVLAAAGCTPGTTGFKSALRMLEFPEPAEACLGYTARGTRGAGSGGGFAGLISSAMCDAIGRGVTKLDHFEQLDILREGIGPDRISDITTTILKPELIEYTQDIARARGVPMVQHKVRAGRFNTMRHGFETVTVELPTNPATGGPIILVPARFLRDLPAINAVDWWEDMRATELRDELNADVLGKVKKKDIVKLARRFPERVQAWVKAREKTRIAAYDLARDPQGLYQWSSATRRWAKANPVVFGVPSTEAEFHALIEVIIKRFKHFIQDQRGWSLLWDKTDEKPEEAIQLVFLGIAKAYCDANDINVDREVELGRGPVDFKFSNGKTFQALIEVKKLENGKFWNGLRAQLPSYLKSNESRTGWILAVRFRTKGIAATRARDLPREVRKIASDLGLDVRYGLVDARKPKSASKLTPDALGGVA